MGFIKLSNFSEYQTLDRKLYKHFVNYALMKTPEDIAEEMCLVIVQMAYDDTHKVPRENLDPVDQTIAEIVQIAYDHNFDYILVELITSVS